MTHIVWASLVTIAYTYIGFPIIVLLRASIRPSPILDRPVEPSISIIIAAHNEAQAIGSKLQSVLEADYPAAMREVIVVSDGSTDETAEIVAQFSDRGVALLDLPRVGKAAALNAGIERAAGSILVFTDANSLLAPDSLRELVRPFGDPGVGGVAGDQRYVGAPTHASAGERRYWDIDRVLKIAESTGGSVVSATGALYAIRTSLVDPVPDGVTDDFAISTGVIARGARLVFAPRAVAFEPPAPDMRSEWSRKVRVITRGLRAVILRRGLLNPRRHGFYAVQLASHKVLRRLMFIPLIALAVSAPLAWRHGVAYRMLTLGQCAAYGAGLVGLVQEGRGLRVHRAFAFPAFFIMANAASMVAALRIVTGRSVDRWATRR